MLNLGHLHFLGKFPFLVKEYNFTEGLESMVCGREIRLN